jgi:hypothetical protein
MCCGELSHSMPFKKILGKIKSEKEKENYKAA